MDNDTHIEKKEAPREDPGRGRRSLAQLFEGLKARGTPVAVDHIAADIDSFVKTVRFDGWQETLTGKQEVKKALRNVIWLKYNIKDKEVFDKAFREVEKYY
ncbi:hypothetical protein DWV16_18135 [Anaerotruncus sp. AF02-27]|nr:hypothetical protein DWV16_18135 [Anaerotruncus sp. AF02-27]